MNDQDLDDLLRDSLRARADRITAEPEAARAVLHAGRQGRDRPGNLVVAIPVLVAAAVGAALVISLVQRPANQLPDATRSSQGVEPTTGATDSPDPGLGRGSPDADGLGPVTLCADVPNLPAGVEVDTVLARELGQLMISFTDPKSPDAEQVQFVLDYQHDSTCGQRVDIQRVWWERSASANRARRNPDPVTSVRLTTAPDIARPNCRAGDPRGRADPTRKAHPPGSAPRSARAAT